MKPYLPLLLSINCSQFSNKGASHRGTQLVISILLKQYLTIFSLFFKFCYKLSLVSLASAVWTCSAVRFFSINSDLYQLVMDFRLINHSVDSVNGYYFYIFSSRNIDISTCNARFTREERIWMWRSEKCTGKLKEVKLTVATDFVLSKWMSGKPVLTSTNKE